MGMHCFQYMLTHKKFNFLDLSKVDYFIAYSSIFRILSRTRWQLVEIENIHMSRQVVSIENEKKETKWFKQ